MMLNLNLLGIMKAEAGKEEVLAKKRHMKIACETSKG